MAGLADELEEIFGDNFDVAKWGDEEGIADAEITERVQEQSSKMAAARAAEIGPEVMRRVEKMFLLNVLDSNWREHLQQLDHLRSGIWLRSHGQRDPINEFKTESFALFEGLLNSLRRDVVRVLMHVQVRAPEEDLPQRREVPTTETHINPSTGENEMQSPRARESAGIATLSAQRRAKEVNPNDPSTWGHVPRNAPCPCGSGKKYKHCHGALGANPGATPGNVNQA